MLTSIFSRAIICYLADKYPKEDDDTLYPGDAQKRALIHQRLFFDMGTLAQRFINYYVSIFHETFRYSCHCNISEHFVNFR